MERCRSENVSYGYEAVRIVVRATHGLKVGVGLAKEPVFAPVSLGKRGEVTPSARLEPWASKERSMHLQKSSARKKRCARKASPGFFWG